MIETRNNRILCTPVPPRQSKTLQNGPLRVAAHKIELVELEVVYGNNSYAQGAKVYVRGDAATTAWGKEILTFRDKDVILVPESEVILVETNAYKPG